MKTQSDEQLMEQVGQGSQPAFLELVERWQHPLYRFFRLLGEDAHEAEDRVQETFLRLFSYRQRYRRRGASFRAFLFRLGRNVAADAHRTRRRRPLRLGLEGGGPEEPAVPDPAGRAGDALDVRDALEALPERLRAVVALAIYEGLSYRETAQALGIPVGTVKSRMHHALNLLRDLLHAETPSP